MSTNNQFNRAQFLKFVEDSINVMKITNQQKNILKNMVIPMFSQIGDEELLSLKDKAIEMINGGKIDGIVRTPGNRFA